MRACVRACVRVCVRACVRVAPLLASLSICMHSARCMDVRAGQAAALRPELAAQYRSDRARFDETAAEWTREYAIRAGECAL